jgi:hypothetical protein
MGNRGRLGLASARQDILFKKPSRMTMISAAEIRGFVPLGGSSKADGSRTISLVASSTAIESFWSPQSLTCAALRPGYPA